MMRQLSALWHDSAGAVIIETAFVTPALLLMSLGGYQVSQVVARQHELQAGADQAMEIAIGGWTDNDQQMGAMKSVLQRTTKVTEENIAITRMYRCGTDPDYITDKTTCATDKVVSTYLRLKLNDSYTPIWADFGIGDPINLAVTRMVQVS